MDTASATQLALFLAGIWAASKGMLDASGFVNELRDTVVIGRKQGEALTLAHRTVLRNDWLLTMTAAVLFPAMYAAFLLVIALAHGGEATTPFKFVLVGVACIPIVGSFLFVLCGIGDWRLMQASLGEAQTPEPAKSAE
jgi:hypothetical protein